MKKILVVIGVGMGLALTAVWLGGRRQKNLSCKDSGRWRLLPFPTRWNSYTGSGITCRTTCARWRRQNSRDLQ